MNEYIDVWKIRKAFSGAVCAKCDHKKLDSNGVCESESECDDATFCFTEIDDIILNAPKADVKKVRHAHWDVIYSDDGSEEFIIHECSWCDARFTEKGISMVSDWYYCPTCGSRMDEEDSESE